MIYQEQMYIGLFNLIDDRCQQYYNVLIILQSFLNETHFHPFYL